jgi:hypothetical protein
VLHPARMSHFSRLRKGCYVARPSYLARRGDGRYFLQIRLGKQAAKLFGLPLLRVSLRTGDFDEARRRLVDNLVWVQELIEAPDLEALGTVLDARLRAYVDRGSPADERILAERCAFEHEVRRFLTRAHERGYAYPMRFPKMPSLWVDFVNQNKAAETSIARLNVRRSYEAGRRDATEATNEGWVPEAKAASPVRSEAFDPIAMIDRLVQDAVAQRVAQLVPANVVPLAPAVTPTETGAPTEPAKSDGLTANTSDRMSAVLQQFLRPAGRKRQHKMKGRGEAEAVVQFAIDFLGDPRMNELTEQKWKLLDEALPDIPNRNKIPRECSETLFQRYKYAEAHGWSKLTRVTTTTIKSRYWGGLYKFIDWAIQEKRYHGPRYTFECIDQANLAPLPRDAFDDDEEVLGKPQRRSIACSARHFHAYLRSREKRRSDGQGPSDRGDTAAGSPEPARRRGADRARCRLWRYRHQPALRAEAGDRRQRGAYPRIGDGRRVADLVGPCPDRRAQIRHPDPARRQSR